MSAMFQCQSTVILEYPISPLLYIGEANFYIRGSLIGDNCTKHIFYVQILVAIKSVMNTVKKKRSG